MLGTLAKIGHSAWYWLTIITLGITMEGVALFYQYALDYLPCVLCIHTRIWVLGLIVVAALALLVRGSRLLCAMGHALTALVAIGLLERSWMLLGTERGTVVGTCDFDLGLPAWLALEQWFPALFKVWEACGYTPELLFGITMAEGLVVIAAGLVLVSITLLIATVLGKNS